MKNKIVNLKLSPILFCIALISSAYLKADDKQSSALNMMSNGTVEAAQLSSCTLNPGKTLKDVNNLLPMIENVHDEIGLDAFFGVMTPLFVSPTTKIDFIFADFAPFENLSKAWDQYLVSESGALLQASLDEIATCNRSLHRYYHQFTKISDDKSRVLSMNWCSKKKSVSNDQLMAKHRSFAASSKIRFLHWGIAVPAWGLRQDDIPGDYAHFIGYPDIKEALASQQDTATKGGWKNREEYLTYFADCSGENLWRFEIANIPDS